MSLSLCLPPCHGGRDSEQAGWALVQSPGASAGGAPPGLPAVRGSCSSSRSWPRQGRLPVKVFAPPSAWRKEACFFSRGGGMGVGFIPSRATFPCLLWLTVSGMLARVSVLDSWGLVCRLLIEGGGGLGGGDRGLSVPFALGVLVHCRFRPPLRSWLCTFKKRGLIKHRAPLVWLHSSSEGVLVFIECTPFIRQSWREAGQTPSEETVLWGGGGFGSLLSAGELQKSESHYQWTQECKYSTLGSFLHKFKKAYFHDNACLWRGRHFTWSPPTPNFNCVTGKGRNASRPSCGLIGRPLGLSPSKPLRNGLANIQSQPRLFTGEEKRTS